MDGSQAITDSPGDTPLRDKGSSLRKLSDLTLILAFSVTNQLIVITLPKFT